MRYTEYHKGMAVIKDKALLKEAMKKLAKYEDCEESKINGDIVRNMSDEDLAAVILCPYGSDGITCKDNERGLSCIDCSLEWIRAEG
ncbi:MAG: hypothetical protein PHT76_11905 [Anaerostipes sp.]|nr:hypothetical protein [Anaerostipes sp.]